MAKGVLVGVVRQRCRALTSSAASSLVAKAVCPSCHRNSLVLRKGWGCLNSHLWREKRGRGRSEKREMDFGLATLLCTDFPQQACNYEVKMVK